MYPRSITEPTLEQLHKGGIHFVLCRSKDEGTKKAKSAIASRCRNTTGVERVQRRDGVLNDLVKELFTKLNLAVPQRALVGLVPAR